MLDSLFFLAQTTTSSDSGSVSPVFWLCYAIIIIVGYVAPMWVLFQKAGKPGWAAIIPIYNLIVMLDIVGRPIWWIILFFIPFVNFVVTIMVWLDFAKSYGKDTAYGCGLIILPIIFLPLMAFTGDTRYVGPAAG